MWLHQLSMEQSHEVECRSDSEPASPTAQYLNSSALSLGILAVMEFEVILEDWQSKICPLLELVFLPINPRFSSIMVEDESGARKWKRVNVKLEDHVHVPEVPSYSSPSENDEFLRGYLSQIALEPFPQTRPPWEAHVIPHPTTEAAATLVFKLHHSLGDGYSLISALFSCLTRADDPSLPLTLPEAKEQPRSQDMLKSLKALPWLLVSAFNTAREFGNGVMRSTFLKDEQSPIWSGEDGIEFRTFSITNMKFSLDEIKQVKSRLQVTINDVICGMIFLGVRMYMRNESQGSAGVARSTGLVLLNTRILREYKTIKEMVEPGSKTPWGNHFSFLQIEIPKLPDSDVDNPLKFVHKARNMIKRIRSSYSVHLTAQLLEMIKNIRGPEVAAKYLSNMLKNSSMMITNVVGPVEKLALLQCPIKGLYFMVPGVPQSLSACILSYAGNLRISITAEKGFIDSQKLASCIADAFATISQAAGS